MIASDKVQEIASKLQQLNAEEKHQLFMLVPSLWESIPVENLITLLSQEEKAIRHGTEYRLDKKKQKRLSQLLEKNRSGILTPAEEEEIDQLIEEGEELTLLKAQALYALKLLARRLLQNANESVMLSQEKL
jgi:3-dehydroquinate synthase class II